MSLVAKIWVTFLLFLSSGVYLDTDIHGIYISVIEVDHDTQTQSGKITIKSFSDDLTNALRSMNFNIPADANPCDEQESLLDYLSTHFQLQYNATMLEWTFEDCSIENDTHWIHLEYSLSEELVTRIEVETDWMTELFGNQQNIIKINVDGERVNARLSKEHTSQTFDF